MPKAYTSTVVNAPADEVWAYLRDFNDLPKWSGGIVVSSEIEGGLGGDQVGAVRSFNLGDGEHLREKLLSHSDEERCYSYDFQKKPFDVDNYVAMLKVTPITDGDVSFVEWSTTFDCDRDRQEEWKEFFSKEVFQGALNAVKEHFS